INKQTTIIESPLAAPREVESQPAPKQANHWYRTARAALSLPVLGSRYGARDRRLRLFVPDPTHWRRRRGAGLDASHVRFEHTPVQQSSTPAPVTAVVPEMPVYERCGPR